MRLCRILMILPGLLLVLSLSASAAEGQTPEPDPTVLRFVQRALPWCPDSTFEMVENTRHQTPSGSYRVVTVERNSTSKALTAKPTVLVDEVSSSIGTLPLMILWAFTASGCRP